MQPLRGNKEFQILSKARGIVPMKVLLWDIDIDCALPALMRVGTSLLALLIPSLFPSASAKSWT